MLSSFTVKAAKAQDGSPTCSSLVWSIRARNQLSRVLALLFVRSRMEFRIPAVVFFSCWCFFVFTATALLWRIVLWSLKWLENRDPTNSENCSIDIFIVKNSEESHTLCICNQPAGRQERRLMMMMMLNCVCSRKKTAEENATVH